MKIDLNITAPRGAKKETPDQEKPAKRRLVWPTMLDDEDPIPPPFRVKFFDGATINRFRPVEDWGVPNSLSPNPGWRAIRDWSKPVTERNTVSQRYSEFGIRLYRPQTWYVTLFSNDPDVDPAVIEREYGPDNDHRWDRMPLKVAQGRDEHKRWPARHGEYNIRLQFKQTNDADIDPRVDVSPDLIEDGDAIKRARLGTKPDGEYFVWGGINTGIVGLYVEEIGVKTMGHYLDTDLESGNYTYDWIDAKGIHFPYFDTTDTENFKVTRVPRYDCGDEDVVEPYFINPAQYRELSVFWMPRRWGYYRRRIDHRRANNNIYLVPVMWSCSQGTGNPDGGIFDLVTMPGGVTMGHPTPNCGVSVGAPSPCWLPAAPVYCEGGALSEYTGECHVQVDFTDNEHPLEPCGNVTETTGSGIFEPYTTVGTVPYGCKGKVKTIAKVICYNCIIERPEGYEYDPSERCPQCNDFEPSGNYTASITEWYGDPGGPSQAGDRNIYMDLLIWYDRPPVDFRVPSIADRLVQAEVTTSPGLDHYVAPSGSTLWAGHNPHIAMVGDESQQDAIDHAVLANVPPEEIKDIISGYRSYHLFGWPPQAPDGDDDALTEADIWVATDAWGVSEVDRDGSWVVHLPLASRAWIRSCGDAKPLKTYPVVDYPLLSPQYRDDPELQGLEWYGGGANTPYDNPDMWPHYSLFMYGVTYSGQQGHPLVPWHETLISRRERMEGYEDAYPDFSLGEANFPTSGGGISCGICECQEGFLVAVLRLGQDAYYVWRKTPEQFKTRTVVVGNGVPKFYPGFEPKDVRLTHGTGRKATSALAMPEWYCASYQSNEWPRWPYGHSRTRVTESGPASLDPPIYIMFSREGFYRGERINLPTGDYYVTPSRFMRRNVVWPEGISPNYSY